MSRSARRSSAHNRPVGPLKRAKDKHLGWPTRAPSADPTGITTKSPVTGKKIVPRLSTQEPSVSASNQPFQHPPNPQHRGSEESQGLLPNLLLDILSAFGHATWHVPPPGTKPKPLDCQGSPQPSLSLSLSFFPLNCVFSFCRALLVNQLGLVTEDSR